MQMIIDNLLSRMDKIDADYSSDERISKREVLEAIKELRDEIENIQKNVFVPVAGRGPVMWNPSEPTSEKNGK